MTLRAGTVRERLRKLRETLRNLEEIKAIPPDELLSSYRRYWLAERGLHLAAETVFDIGIHILAGHLNVHPSDYEDVLTRLSEQGVIPRPLRERLRGLGGFRNILVHGYLDIDRNRLIRTLREELGAFVEFAEAIEEFLETVEKGQ